MRSPSGRSAASTFWRRRARTRSCADWNDTARAVAVRRRLPELFAAQVAAHARCHRGGVRGRRRLSYGELDARANQLAHHLRALGVGPEVVVGLCVERSLEMLVGLLGILKAGGAYLPLDPSYPRERLAFMLEDAGAPVLVTQSALLDRLPAHGARIVRLDADWPRHRAQPTTAPAVALAAATPRLRHLHLRLHRNPKGVAVAHGGDPQSCGYPDRSLRHHLRKPASCSSHRSSFDGALWEISGPL